MENGGYLVLRLPKQNFDKDGRGAFLPIAPSIGNLYYGGIDRMPWFDLDEQYYLKNLPENYIALREKISSLAIPNFDIRIAQLRHEAETILHYCNETSNINELVYASLASFNCPAHVGDAEEIGCDLYCSGYGSLIRTGIFSAPKQFSNFTLNLNRNGLFNYNDETLDSYIETYHAISHGGHIEKFEGDVVRVRLFRPTTAR